MTDDQLLRALRSVGYAAFVTHLELFLAAGEPAIAAETLHRTTGWAPTACRTRVNSARLILTSGRLRDALEVVAAAEKVADTAKAKARHLLRA